MKKRAKREIRRHKRVKQLVFSGADETTKGFRVYAIPGMKKPKPKKFTLMAPLRRPGKRAKFLVRDDNTGMIVFESYKRLDAETKQRELLAA